MQNRVDEDEVALAGYFDMCDDVNLGCLIVGENAGMFSTGGVWMLQGRFQCGKPTSPP